MSTGVQVGYVANDNLIWIRSATLMRSGELVEAGVGWLTAVLDGTGDVIGGQTFPTIMLYSGADGHWVTQLDSTAELLPGFVYTAVVDLDAGPGTIGHWETPFVAQTRTSE